jgi:hypothetical protein
VRVHARHTSTRVDHVALRHLFVDHDGPVGIDLDGRSWRVLQRARVLVGKRSRRLLGTGRRSRGRTTFGPYHDVTFGRPGLTPYLGYHMDGTGAHVIRPRRRKALRFVSGGQIVFARKVQHPGTKANRFLVRALDAAR